MFAWKIGDRDKIGDRALDLFMENRGQGTRSIHNHSLTVVALIVVDYCRVVASNGS